MAFFSLSIIKVAYGKRKQLKHLLGSDIHENEPGHFNKRDDKSPECNGAQMIEREMPVRLAYRCAVSIALLSREVPVRHSAGHDHLLTGADELDAPEEADQMIP